ncbi:hypothetical protein SSP24_74980 [Streptomyces spinoverrucosus]|uniref:Uncharacterized protein n=1 Tax=Streptomyces spinoverrucosus TaxID=284043 RepID=A0A4Y3VT89_9ACTN|nr:hypothetical protein SSP24_74980 [Streptomyces spinoverrucosus]GHB97395.1 hypothetical protein GCM10010397_82450 [Streptomyces spinoverrucosus]
MRPVTPFMAIRTVLRFTWVPLAVAGEVSSNRYRNRYSKQYSKQYSKRFLYGEKLASERGPDKGVTVLSCSRGRTTRVGGLMVNASNGEEHAMRYRRTTR